MTFQRMTLIFRKLSIGKESYLLLSQFTIHLKPRLNVMPPKLFLVFWSHGRACSWRSLPWCSTFHRSSVVSGPGSVLVQKPSVLVASGARELPESVLPTACAPARARDSPSSDHRRYCPAGPSPPRCNRPRSIDLRGGTCAAANDPGTSWSQCGRSRYRKSTRSGSLPGSGRPSETLLGGYPGHPARNQLSAAPAAGPADRIDAPGLRRRSGNPFVLPG